MAVPSRASDSLHGTPPTGGGAGKAPYDEEYVYLTKREYIELRASANSYRSLHRRACQRIAELQAQHRDVITAHKTRVAAITAELEKAKAELRGLRQRHFGTKSERANSCKPRDNTTNGRTPSGRPRGQQPGSTGHGRTRLNKLPAREEWVGTDRRCPRCGKPMAPIAGSKDTEVVEIEVCAHRRVIRRQRYRASCNCGCLPAVTAAPPPAQLIPRGKLGISVWVELLLSKYRYAQPTHRFCQDWRDRGVPLAQGTITEGLHTLQPLFAPLCHALLEHLRAAHHWHADETLWPVFEAVEGKIGHTGYLWLFLSRDAVYFTADPGRSAEIPNRVLTPHASGVLSVDRCGAYQKYAGQNRQVIRALCWAHQRRDFIALAIKHPDLWPWAMQWLARIARLYRFHAARRSAHRSSATFHRCEAILHRHTERMRRRATRERDDPTQHPGVQRLQKLMLRNWQALTVFLDYPDMSLDNNPAERALRLSVVARKNYYGSGSRWSAELAANMMSLFATLALWNINPRLWLTDYLQACAHAGGSFPAQYLRFLPWLVSGEQRMRWGAPAPVKAP